MQINWKKLFYIYKLLRKTENMGDVALLKTDFFGAKINPNLAPKMQPVKGYYPPINLAELKQLPVDSFGYQHANFMQINNLQPLNISPALADIA